MEISLRTHRAIAEIVVKSDNTIITEDVVSYNSSVNRYDIHHSHLEQLINTAREMNQFNGKSDVDFVSWIADAFLNDSEQVELIERKKGGY